MTETKHPDDASCIHGKWPTDCRDCSVETKPSAGALRLVELLEANGAIMHMPPDYPTKTREYYARIVELETRQDDWQELLNLFHKIDDFPDTKSWGYPSRIHWLKLQAAIQKVEEE